MSDSNDFVEHLTKLIEFKVEGISSLGDVAKREPELNKWILQQSGKSLKNELSHSEILSLFLVGQKVKLPETVRLRENVTFPLQDPHEARGLLNEADSIEKQKIASKETKFKANWEYNFQRLSEYRSIYGNSNIPKTEKYQELRNWRQYQYTRFRTGRLPDEERNRLERLGFFQEEKLGVFTHVRPLTSAKNDTIEKSQVFDKFRLADHFAWMKRYCELKEFHEQHGHFRIPRIDDGHRRMPREVGNTELSHWFRYQKRKKSDGRLYEIYEAYLRVAGVTFPQRGVGK